MSEGILADIACRNCQIGGGAVDLTCIQCCVRFLGRLQTRQMVGAHIRSIRRLNSGKEGFADRLDQAWSAYVAKRNETGSKGEQ